MKGVDEEEANRMCHIKFKTKEKLYLSKKALFDDQSWIDALKKKILESNILNA